MWTAEQPFLNDEHREIYENTSQIPGWQAPGDSHRLYEMGYKSGDVILEIGMFGGRSATVELRGALANSERESAPLYFGIDIEFESVVRTLRSLTKQGLDQHALAFHGDLEKFISRFEIQPTMVFVDGDHRYDGVKKDLKLLSKYLIPEIPVLCHDYWHPHNETGEMGVRQAVDEFVAEGWATTIGTSGCSMLLVTSNKCTGAEMPPWTDEKFAQTRAQLMWEYTDKLQQNLYDLQSDSQDDVQSQAAA